MRPRQTFSWFMLLLSTFAGITLFFIPAFIIRPFRQQSPAALALALSLRQRAPWGTFAAFVLCLVFAFVLWQGDSLRRKVILGLLLFLAAFSALMSRVNYFEWMFHPVNNPQFESESASKLELGEMVLAVRLSSDARAYPISEMAYHHILNDTIAGVPIVVTY